MRLLLFLTALIFINCNGDLKKQGLLIDSLTNQVEQQLLEIEELRSDVEFWHTEFDSTFALNDKLIKDADFWVHSRHQFKPYLEQGIDNPKEYIANSLRHQSELIPMEGVYGGIMKFRRIDLLSSQWLIASFDDGHVDGRAIYEFQLENNSQDIRFTLIRVLENE